MSHYKPYPAYKDSGVEWLGKVPEHWELARFDAKSTTHRDSIDADRLTGLRVLHYSIPAVQELGHGQEEDGSEIDSNKLIINQKQLLVSKLNPHKQTLVVADKSESFLTVASTEFVPLIPVAADLAYITYVWSSAYCQHYLLARCESSTRSHQRVAPSDITRMPWAWPALDEQKAVVSVLDRETARIDALIEKKTRFIELLREKRQALITHAVTKGLDPSVKMKDSGVEWLGEVPEHWAVCKLSFRYSVELGKMLDEKRITSTSLMPYLRNQDVQWDAVNAEDLPEMDIYPEELSRYTVRAGDLLVCEGGDVGRAAIWRGENDVIGYQKALHRLRPRNDATDTAEFFFFALMAAKVRGVFEESDSKATIAHLPAEKFRQYRFAFPPAHEQREIAGHIRTHTQRLDKVLITTERSIALLKERRAALITAAVTGQIDLREAV